MVLPGEAPTIIFFDINPKSHFIWFLIEKLGLIDGSPNDYPSLDAPKLSLTSKLCSSVGSPNYSPSQGKSSKTLLNTKDSPFRTSTLYFLKLYFIRHQSRGVLHQIHLNHRPSHWNKDF